MDKWPIEAHSSRTVRPERQGFTMHTHDTCEIFLFLEGDAGYAVEGHVYRLQKGDIMLMHRSEVHHLILHSQADYARCTVNFSPALLTDIDPKLDMLLAMFRDRPFGQFNHYSAALFPDNHWTYYMQKICETKEQSSRLIYLLPLLQELAEAFPTVRTLPEDAPVDKAGEIAAYITRHLFDDLTLQRIADRFYMSTSQLNRVFRRNTGATVWNYVTVKRLMAARERIRAGDMPTRVYEACGFHDYITFFRAYKQQFGVSPRKEKPVTK